MRGEQLRQELLARVAGDSNLLEFLDEKVLDGVWYWDLEQPEHEWMSRRFWEFLGYDPDAMPHTPDAWQDIVFAEDLEIAKANLERHLEDPDHPYDQIVRYRRADGSVASVRCRGVAIADEKGHPTRMLGVHTDVSALKKAEARIVRQSQDLERAVEGLDQFTRMASHDLRRPLRHLSAFSSRLRSRLEDQLDADGVEDFRFIEKAADQMDALLVSLLDLSRAGGVAAGFEEVELAASLRAASETLRDEIQAAGAEFDVGSLGTVWGDPELVTLLCENLMGNAIKYRHPERTPRLHVEASVLGDSLRVSFADNGAGIDAKLGARVFEPFERGVSGRGPAGSGIGLATCERIVQRHGGRLWYESSLGEGSTFHVELPTRAPASASDTSPSQEPDEASQRDRLREPENSAALLRMLIDHLPVYLFLKDSEHRIVGANERFLSLYGEDQRPNVIGSTTVEEYDEAQREEFLAQDKLALSTGYAETTETIDFPNGERRALLTQKLAHVTSSGERLLLGIGTDVTELEKERLRAEEVGRLLDDCVNEVLISDAETLQFVFCNEKAVESLAYSRDELAALTLIDVTSVDSREAFEDLIRPLSRGTVEKLAIQTQHIRKGGRRYDAEMHLRRGTFRGRDVISAVSVDTSELVRNRNELDVVASELMELSYRSSHDLRAPLLSARALLDAVERAFRIGEPEQARAMAAQAKASLEGLDALNQSLDRLAQLDRGPGGATSVDPEALIDEVLQAISDQEGFDEMTLTRHRGYGGSIQLEAAPLRTIVENLVANAVRFRNPDTVMRALAIRTLRDARGALVLEFVDNGLGVPEGYEGRLFRMFGQLHPRISSGSGLGLYLCDRAAKQLGGCLEFERMPEGSLFRVCVPAAA